MSANHPVFPDSCPACGAVRKKGWENVYECGSAFHLPGGNWKPGVEERGHCFQRQRAALAARVKELEAALTEANEQRARFGAQMVRVQERCLKLEAYAGRLATAGDVVSAHAPDDAYLRWFAAKETKP